MICLGVLRGMTTANMFLQNAYFTYSLTFYVPMLLHKMFVFCKILIY